VEIISYADFVAAGGETQARRAGKMRLEAEYYAMQDYDLTHFRFNRQAPHRLHFPLFSPRQVD
jgi:hypothetical protein